MFLFHSSISAARMTSHILKVRLVERFFTVRRVFRLLDTMTSLVFMIGNAQQQRLETGKRTILQYTYTRLASYNC